MNYIFKKMYDHNPYLFFILIIILILRYNKYTLLTQVVGKFQFFNEFIEFC
jgi:hypothetical protein